ncbi:ATP-dependent protease ATPase subunit HslU [Rickettsiales bacterium LUAb2]
MKNFTPKEIVSELDKYIIGQDNAKKAVAIALRNRYRRRLLTSENQQEILPKNILMIGSTGVGKTEIARRLSKLDDSPFIKVEATKFTEIGYVGRDVEQIIRDLLEISIHTTSEKMKTKVKIKAEIIAKDKILSILVGENASDQTKQKFKEKLKNKELDEQEIEIEVKEKSNNSPFVDIPGMQGAQISMIPLSGILGGEKTKKLKVSIKEALKILTEEESDKLLDKDEVIKISIDNVENNGLVFIDEIDKVANLNDGAKSNSNISREGVQRDLLPLVEGTTVSTKHGPVNTDHILFIAGGAFHLSKPSDLLPELQGRFPIRVELNSLTKDDLKRVLIEPKNNLVKQYTLLLETEKVTLIFEEDAIDEIADMAVYLNQNIENIGARRLQTILEKVLEDINFEASEKANTTFTVTKNLVTTKIADIAKNQDLSKFIL